jgi:hypothetical protein
LDTKYITLQSKYGLLHSKFEQLQLNHTSLEKFAFQLQQKLAALESLKGVANLGMIIDARNETNRLELELQMTNNTSSSFSSFTTRSSNLKRERFSSTKISNNILKCLSESVGIVVVCGCVLSSNKNPEQQVNNDKTMILCEKIDKRFQGRHCTCIRPGTNQFCVR